MNGFEFEKRIKRHARSKGLACYFVEHGKGSHGRLYLGNRFTTIKDRRKEIGKGLLAAMYKQLDINPRQL